MIHKGGAQGVLGAARRAAWSFAPRSMPRLSRRNYSREVVATICFAVGMAGVEGSILGVMVKKTFESVVPDTRLSFMVAFIAAAPEFANILSFIWVSLSHGRAKVPFVNGLQLAVLALVAMIAVIPRSEPGLYMLAALALGARVAWSGIVTLRPTLWRANYPREARARIIGKLSTFQILAVAGMGVLIGTAMDSDQRAFRVIVPACAAVGLGAVLAFRRVRVRRHKAMLAEERKLEHMGRPWQGPGIVWSVLRKDRWFARFMLWMFVLGMGNLMLAPVLVLALCDPRQFDLGYRSAIGITGTIPLVVMTIAMPLWARFLDRAHVVRFRSIHSWAFVASGSVITLAAVLGRLELMVAGAVLQGVAFAGGTLAWNLGHVDFALPSHTSQYMAAHVTLNGVRGLLGPFLSVAIYEGLQDAGLTHRESASVVFALCTACCAAGAMGFVTLRRTMGPRAHGSARLG